MQKNVKNMALSAKKVAGPQPREMKNAKGKRMVGKVHPNPHIATASTHSKSDTQSILSLILHPFTTVLNYLVFYYYNIYLIL